MFVEAIVARCAAGWDLPIGGLSIAVNGIPIVARCRSLGWRRAFKRLLIGVQRCGAVLAHHVVAEIDGRQPDEFRDVQDLDIAEARERAADRLREKISAEEVASVNASLARSLAQLQVKRRRR